MSERLISGRYRLERELGSGGMGTVWAGFDTQLHRPVAVKLVHHTVEQADATRAMLASEARAAAQLQHPGIVQVYDFGIDNTTGHEEPYLVMELLNGENLERRLAQRKRLPLSEVVSLISQVARALSATHAFDLYHLDLKPANIFLTRHDDREVVKILDFGVSKLGSSGMPSDATVWAGTPQYMSPEQAYGDRKVDYRSDLYSLAVVAYRALTGQLPIDADTSGEYVFSLVEKQPPIPLPSKIVPGLGPAVDRFFERALAYDPAKRFQSARELAAALASLDGGPGKSRPAKVLVVDDEPNVITLIRKSFRRQIAKGMYEFVFAANGRAALDELQHHVDIDLIVSDINMPEMDGLALLQRVSDMNPLIRVIIVSAYGDMRNIREAMNRGAFDFLTKPIDFTDLEVTLDKTIRFVHTLRNSVERAEENSLLRMFANTGVIDRLLPLMRSSDIMSCDVSNAAMAMIELRGPILNEQQAPDALVYRCNQLFDTFLPEITSRGGNVERFFGSGVLLSFRGPDSGVRAVLACVSARAKVDAQLASMSPGGVPRGRLAIAVDTGDVISSIVGAPAQRRMDYTVLGTAVTHVMSLVALASPGQILITAALAQQAGAGFPVSPVAIPSLQAQQVHDRLAEVQLFEVGGGELSAISQGARADGDFQTVTLERPPE